MTPPTRPALLACLAPLAGVPAALRAQAPAPPPVIDACYVPASGTIYRINTAASPARGAPNGCLSAAHVRFTWNQQGPKGDRGDAGAAGAPGVSGYTVVSLSTHVEGAAPGGRSYFDTRCPPGTRAIGGGVGQALGRANLLASWPRTVNGTDVWAVELDVLTKTLDFVSYAVCARVSP